MANSVPLSDKAIEALAYYFMFWWAVLALKPGNNRSVRSLLAHHGLIEPKGKLALTPLGKKVLDFCQADGRPKYPKKRPAKRSRHS